jgi:hypothetical protein
MYFFDVSVRARMCIVTRHTCICALNSTYVYARVYERVHISNDCPCVHIHVCSRKYRHDIPNSRVTAVEGQREHGAESSYTDKRPCI